MLHTYISVQVGSSGSQEKWSLKFWDIGAEFWWGDAQTYFGTGYGDGGYIAH